MPIRRSSTFFRSSCSMATAAGCWKILTARSFRKVFARKVFGNDDPIGKSLRISDSTSVMVTGVMEDINRSVIPNADLVGAYRADGGVQPVIVEDESGVMPAPCVSFLLLKPGTDLKGRTDEIQSFFKERYWIYRYDFVKEVRVVRFRTFISGIRRRTAWSRATDAFRWS